MCVWMTVFIHHHQRSLLTQEKPRRCNFRMWQVVPLKKYGLSHHQRIAQVCKLIFSHRFVLSYKHRATSEQARCQSTYRSVHIKLTIIRTQWSRRGHINEPFTNIEPLLASLCLETQINADLSHNSEQS